MPYLTDTKIRHAKPKDKDYKLYDEQGLFLLICATGSKLWRFRYHFNGKEKLLSLGNYPHCSVAEAREERNSLLATLGKGEDPAIERKKKKNILKDRKLFRDIAESYFEEHKNIWSEQHRKDVRGRLNNYILPAFGNRHPDEILPIEIFELLKKIQGPRREEGKHYDLAKKVKGIISQIFCKAVTERECLSDPCRDLRNVLVAKENEHYSAFTEDRDIQLLMRAMAQYHGSFIVKQALYFSAYTFCRPTEIRHTRWEEIFWDKAYRIIPGKDMKKKRDHIVPLSKQALNVLSSLKPISGEREYVFCGIRHSKRPMSEATIGAALASMGFDSSRMTAHGFRAMASTVLYENGWPSDAIELQLSHVKRDKVRAAYDRSRLLSTRREMMQWYADYLDNLALE